MEGLTTKRLIDIDDELLLATGSRWSSSSVTES